MYNMNQLFISLLIMSSMCITQTMGQSSTSQDRHNFLFGEYDMYAPGATEAPGDVGYYDMSAGQGIMPQQSDPIANAGCSPVQIFDLSAAELASIDILVVQNPDNGGYGAEYLSQLATIETAVNNGLILIIHDRYLTDAAGILPGGGGIAAVRDFLDDANVDIVDNTTPVTVGLDDSSLDGGNSSSHGYVDATTLPAGALNILSRTITNESVLFSYPHGSGAVMYSSIPLDFYLDGDGNNPPRDNMITYAANVVSYGKLFVPAIVPTLSEWAIISLGLLMMIIGTVAISQPKEIAIA